MDQIEYWNSVAYEKTFSASFPYELFRQFIDKQDKILEVGCGYGRILGELYKKGYSDLHGIDVSESMIERAQKTYPQLVFQVHQGEQLPFPDHFFNAVLLVAVLTCISSNDRQIQLISEIQRIVQPEGVICVVDFLLNEDDRNLERYNNFFPVYNTYGVFELPEGALVRHHDLKWIRKLFSGWKELEFQGRVFKTMNNNTSKGFWYLGRNY